MGFKYLSADVLKGFDNYKYSSVDDSPLSKYVTHPFWNFTVQYFPLWLAPNVMTLTGFLILVVNFVLFSYCDWDFTAAERSLSGQTVIPGWLWLSAAIGTFIAHTLDGCDGKQARRTKSSSPLGELFDHGLDSWTCLLLPSTFYSVFGRGLYGANVTVYFWIMLFVYFSFILSHWEKYNTGILYLPWTYDLSQLGMTLVFFIPYWYGFEWINHRLPVVDVTFSVFCISVFAVCLAILAFGVSFLNVYRSYREKSGNMLPFTECIRPLVPCILWFALMSTWIHLSPSQIIERQPRLVYIVTGTVFSNITCRLIVNQMSKTRCDGFNVLILPLLVLLPFLLTCPSLYEHEEKFLLIYVVMAVLAHLHYGTNVVKQMAEHFHIFAFSLEKPMEQNGNAKKAQ